MAHSRTCLVVEPFAVIAEDLAMTLQEIDPGLRTVIAANMHDAMSALGTVPAVHLALVHADPARFAGAPLAGLLGALGAFVVYMGDAAEQANGRTDVLGRPYSVEALAGMLAQAARRPPDALSD